MTGDENLQDRIVDGEMWVSKKMTGDENLQDRIVDREMWVSKKTAVVSSWYCPGFSKASPTTQVLKRKS